MIYCQDFNFISNFYLGKYDFGYFYNTGFHGHVSVDRKGSTSPATEYGC